LRALLPHLAPLAQLTRVCLEHNYVSWPCARSLLAQLRACAWAAEGAQPFGTCGGGITEEEEEEEEEELSEGSDSSGARSVDDDIDDVDGDGVHSDSGDDGVVWA
jgi:hypothetical protein